MAGGFPDPSARRAYVLPCSVDHGDIPRCTLQPRAHARRSRDGNLPHALSAQHHRGLLLSNKIGKLAAALSLPGCRAEPLGSPSYRIRLPHIHTSRCVF